ncbi:MAG: FecR domain-containing protein [Cyclobacteriaceae bacterium]
MENHIDDIIAKDLAGQATDQERATLGDWLKDKQNKREYNFLRLTWSQGNSKIETSKDKVFSGLKEKLGTQNETIVHQIGHNERSWNIWVKVAAVLVLVSGISFLFLNEILTEEEQITAQVNTIIKENPKGVKRNVMLPDGTEVWLNSESTLSYQASFTDSSRIVKLVGEAYFEVAKDKSRPFSVISGDLVTTALGTAFNVNAFSDQAVSIISLAEGKVKVEMKSKEEVLYLNPGYSAILNKTQNELNSGPFDPEIDLAWKEGTLLFRDANKNEVFSKLERWFGVEFKFENQSTVAWNLTTKFENESLEEVLKVIGFKMKFDFKIENKIVTIKYSEKL